MATVQTKQQVRKAIKQNESKVFILSLIEFQKLWLYEMERLGNLTSQEAREQWQKWRGIGEIAANYTATTNDIL